jgi:glycosyltransferase involved in cell wall biosynthesis
MAKLPISCFIISRNEADRIGRSIRSVIDWVDEVVVVDSSSSNATIAVSQKEGARVISNSWPGFGQQKRFAEDQCRNNWLLNIDADEVVTHELRRKIEELFANGPPPLVGYGIPICLVYPGAKEPRKWARDHWCVRLYDRSVVRFRDSSIHDSVVTDGHEVGDIAAPLYHFSIRSFDDMKRKLDRRMWISMQHTEVSVPLRLMPRLLTEFPMHFFKYYIVRRHFMGGLDGLRYAQLQSWYRLLRIYRMIRANGRYQDYSQPADCEPSDLLGSCDARHR